MTYAEAANYVTSTLDLIAACMPGGARINATLDNGVTLSYDVDTLRVYSVGDMFAPYFVCNGGAVEIPADTKGWLLTSR